MSFVIPNVRRRIVGRWNLYVRSRTDARLTESAQNLWGSGKLVRILLVILAVAPSVSGQERSAASPFDSLVFYCTECMTEVPETLGAGSNCPHCGAYFKSATNVDGTESQALNQRPFVSVRVLCGAALLSIFATEYAWRKWKQRQVR